MNTDIIPEHIAIIMDGNGRWAKKRHLPRIAGHKAGADVVREIVKACAQKKIKVLTLFAFSSENWQRPPQEVSYLMSLFMNALQREVKKLHQQNIQLRVVGDRSRFDDKLLNLIAEGEKLTEHNNGLKLIIAVNYGGRWDLTEAVRKIAMDVEQGKLTSKDITPIYLQNKLAFSDLPEPDLFIRTSGEQRISNFMLWQLAYTELYFTPVLWPDFNTVELDKALNYFANRERRFGCTGEQLRAEMHA